MQSSQEGTQAVSLHTSALQRRPVWETVNHRQTVAELRDRKEVEGPWLQVLPPSTQWTAPSSDSTLDLSWCKLGFC